MIYGWEWQDSFIVLEACLSLPNPPKFVPALHSNQSSIEALFASMRAAGRDSTSKHSGGMSARNGVRTNASENVLANNKMRSKEDVATEQDDLHDSELVLGKGVKQREATAQEWISGRADSAENEADEGVSTSHSSMNVERSTFGKAVLPKLKRKHLSASCFSRFLSSNAVFQEFAMLSVGGESEEWFKKLCKGMSEEEEKKFDETCQKMTQVLWSCLRGSVTTGNKNSIEASHHHQVLAHAQGAGFEKMIDSFPDGLARNRHGANVLLQLFSRCLLQDWIPEALRSIREQLDPAKAKTMDQNGKDEEGEVKVD
jgi:hypothetical protein